MATLARVNHQCQPVNRWIRHHDNPDASHTPQLQSVLSAVAFAMDEAERLGIADKLYIIVGSDFARTHTTTMEMVKTIGPLRSMMMMGPQIQVDGL